MSVPILLLVLGFLRESAGAPGQRPGIPAEVLADLRTVSSYQARDLALDTVWFVAAVVLGILAGMLIMRWRGGPFAVLILVWSLAQLSPASASASPLAGRACHDYELDQLVFSNCCNASDVYWCTDWLCWTKFGCRVCTPGECWTTYGSGVSIRPQAHERDMRRQAMDLFGLMGLGAYTAEALGMGELYSAGLIAGFFFVGGRDRWTFVCNVSCSFDGITWLQARAPTFTEVVKWISTVPSAIWSLVSTMPLIFASLLGYAFLRGHWPICLVLILGVPGVLANEGGSELEQCDFEALRSSNATCTCPFGVYVRKCSEPAWCDFPHICPEATNLSAAWYCAWGSWWWVAEDVTRPYSHPSMPTHYSAICYVSEDRSAVRNVTIDIGDEDFIHLKGQITTCMLDRRESVCGDCWAGCYAVDGDNSRPFERCGGGYRDGAIMFEPLMVINFSNESSYYWWAPSRHTSELLIASKYRHGYGCGSIAGVLHCWNCSWGDAEPSKVGWLPQPGKPEPLCINPANERVQHDPPNNWLAMLQYITDSITTGVGCPRYDIPAYPVCPGMAWFPTDGSRVVLYGQRQLIGHSPDMYLGFVGLVSVILALCIASGARLVPALLLLAAAFSGSWACYPACTACTFTFCLTSQPCMAVDGADYYWPARNFLSVRVTSDLPPDVWEHWAAGVVVGYLANSMGMPGLASVLMAAPALYPVELGGADYYCGSPGVPDTTVEGYEWTFLAYPLLLFLCGSGLWSFGCVCGVALGIRVRSWFPWRYVAVVLVSACTHAMELAIAAAVSLQAYDLVSGRMGLYAEAALHRGVIAAPALGAALTYPTWPEVILGVLCVIMYCRVVGRAGLAAIVAYKLSRGLLGLAVLCMLFARGPQRGVLGAVLHGRELCLPLDWFATSTGGAWWYVSGCFSFFCISLSLLSPLGRRIKLRIYARWCQLYCRVRLAVSVSPFGRHGFFAAPTMLVWLFSCLMWPRECGTICVGFVATAGSFDFVDWVLEVVLCSAPKQVPLGHVADLAAACLNDGQLSALLQRWWYKGWVLYEHMGQVSSRLKERVEAMKGCLEPVCVAPQDLEAVYDDTLTLTCGKWFGGKPVVARCGNMVLIGRASSVRSLPPGYTLTAPLLVVRPGSGFFKVLKTSLLGRGEVPGHGQIAVLETATGSSMGVATSGVLYATFHGTSGRPVAGPTGPRNPYWTSPSDDVACYPLLEGLTCLEPCSCGDHSRWVLRVDGQLVHGVAAGDSHVALDCPTPLSKLKGASGSPVLCDQGHVVGMMLGAISVNGITHRVRFVRPWAAVPGNPTASQVPEFPTVPADGYKVVSYVAPTGSGKSTKLPLALTALGHRVLVLNPSVVTTKAMYKYIKKLSGKSPNVYAGTGRGSMAISTGSRLTYMTYGRFLVDPDKWLNAADVVLCDECHAVDGTSILGIGCALTEAEKCKVKLLILATATPPGTVITPHSSITEEPLDSTGDVPFYGLTLKSEKYMRGRHVIFCHSKAECARVAGDLGRAGVNAVSYWRGADASVLTEDPDLTVVATDAISTGYTGNFASCTDCCSVVSESVEADLNPTFTLTLGVAPCDAALRMQRRGRTGRGTPGVYRPLVAGAPPNGMTSSSAAWAAAEAGYVWYGRDSTTIQNYLEAYQSSPYTCRMPGDPGEAVRALGVLRPFFQDHEVVSLCLKEQQWPLLYGAQRAVCLRAESQPPSDDIKWAGITGDNAVPLLFRLGTVAAPCVSHPLTRKMAAVLGDTSYSDVSIGPLLLAGVAVAAAVAIVGATGCLTVSSVWEVHTGGSPVNINARSESECGPTQQGGPVPPAAVREEQPDQVAVIRETATSLDYPILTTVWGALEKGATMARGGACAAADAVNAWYTNGAPLVPSVPAGPAGVRVLEILEAHLMAIAAGGLAIVGSRSSPALATVAALVAGITTLAPHGVVWLLSIAGGIAVSMASTPATGTACAAAFFIGTKIASFTFLDTIVGAVCGYEATVNVCALTLELMDGTANASSWLGAVVGLMAPGAAVAGIALALILRGACSGDVTSWLNRLLSCLPRSNVLPDGFFAEKKDPHALSKAVRGLSLTSKIKAWCEASQQDDYTFCADGWCGTLFRSLAALYAWLRNWAADHLPMPKVPYLSCSVGYDGDFDGEGSVSSVCNCGCKISVTQRISKTRFDGSVYETRWSKRNWTCVNSVRRRLPVNTTTTWSGSLQVDLTDERDFTFFVGLSHMIRGIYNWEDDTFTITETTLNRGCRKNLLDAVADGPVAVRGRPVSTYYSGTTLAAFTAGQTVVWDGEQKTLPIQVKGIPKLCYSAYRPKFFDSNADPGAAVVAAEATAAAEAATDLAERTMDAASKMMANSMEARRKAEAEAWALREKLMQRDIFADACAPGADDSDDLALTNRHLYAMMEDPEPLITPDLLREPPRQEPDLPITSQAVPMTAESMKTPDSEDELGDPIPLGTEDILKDAAPLDVVEDVREGVADMKAVMSYASAVAGNIARGATNGVMAVAGAIKAPVEATVDAAVTTVKATTRKAKRLMGKAKATLPRLEGVTDEVPMVDITTLRTIQFRWACGNGGHHALASSNDDTVEDVYSRSNVPKCHPHVFKMGLVTVVGSYKIVDLTDSEVIIDCMCPKHPDVRPKGNLITKILQHRCCGKDESRTKTVGANTPASLLGPLWGDSKGYWLDGDNKVPEDALMGDLGTTLTLVHEEKCGLSYLWSGAPILVGEPKKAPVSRTLTSHLRADATKVYVTDPNNIHQRIQKVTIDQKEAEVDSFLRDAYNLALAKASRITSPGYDYDTAVSKVRPNSARGHVANITVADLKTEKGRRAVEKCLEGIHDGTEEGRFMLRPKSEVFPQTRSTHKPPRLICYPSLEFRVAEKMILGDPAVVAKAVMGESYGFQHPPHRRAEVLHRMWKSMRQPVCYTLDGVCFDSTITQADIGREGNIFAAASTEPNLVRRLHSYYAESPMVGPNGLIVGIRRCRASGTLTTSAGNSITCYLKVTAACRKAGIINPKLLIHGDDVVLICEKQEEDQSRALGEALASYGYVCDPTRHADLSTAESCSATVTMVKTVRGMRPVLTTDMRRGLGRVLAEVGDPVGTAWGYTINYPTNPIVSYVLLPVLLSIALNSGDGIHQLIQIDIRGNSIQMPLSSLGKAIRGLHGPDILCVTGRAPSDISAAVDVLQFFSMRGLGHWRRFRRKVLVRLLRAGKDWATLGRELLWDPGSSAPPILTPDVNILPDELWEWSWEGIQPVRPKVERPWFRRLMYVILGFLALSLV
uniref:Genome polyprotein n=1 Tax=Bat pegivirus TaxID=1112699 RepID=M9ZZM4_9FLAV|nr:polyprotein [Bat pegivirus]